MNLEIESRHNAQSKQGMVLGSTMHSYASAFFVPPSRIPPMGGIRRAGHPDAFYRDGHNDISFVFDFASVRRPPKFPAMCAKPFSDPLTPSARRDASRLYQRFHALYRYFPPLVLILREDIRNLWRCVWESRITRCLQLSSHLYEFPFP